MRFGLDLSSIFTFSAPVPSLTASQYIAGMPGAWNTGARPHAADEPHSKLHQEQEPLSNRKRRPQPAPAPRPQPGPSDKDHATARRALERQRRAVERQPSLTGVSPLTVAIERIRPQHEDDVAPEPPRTRSERKKVMEAARRQQEKKVARRAALQLERAKREIESLPPPKIIKTSRQNMVATPLNPELGPKSWVWVCNFNRFVTADLLKAHFERYVGKGNVHEVSIRCSEGVALGPSWSPMSLECLRTRNYALVTFYTKDGRELALKAEGRVLKNQEGSEPLSIRRNAEDLPFAKLMAERARARSAAEAAERHRKALQANAESDKLFAEHIRRSEGAIPPPPVAAMGGRFAVQAPPTPSPSAKGKGKVVAPPVNTTRGTGRGRVGTPQAAPVNKTASFLSQQKERRAQAVDASRLGRLLKAVQDDQRGRK